MYGSTFLLDNPHWGRFTVPYDFSGSPSISLPSGQNSDGLPLSIQFVGKHLSEPLLCRVGHAYEQATPWQALHPPVCRREIPAAASVPGAPRFFYQGGARPNSAATFSSDAAMAAERGMPAAAYCRSLFHSGPPGRVASRVS